MRIDNGRLRRIAVTLYGEPPAKDAPRLDRLRYVRTINARMLAFCGPLFLSLAILAVAVGTSVTVPLIAFGVCVISGVVNIALGAVRIRREERAED